MAVQLSSKGGVSVFLLLAPDYWKEPSHSFLRLCVRKLEALESAGLALSHVVFMFFS